LGVFLFAHNCDKQYKYSGLKPTSSFQFQLLICIFLKWHQDAVSIRQTHFAVSAANLSRRAKKYSVEASAKMCEAHKAYFGMPVGDQDKPWAPHSTCEHCKKILEGKMDNCSSLGW
jgi:hypothetical protein